MESRASTAVPLVPYVIAPQLLRLFQGWLFRESRRGGSAIR
jgi:antibiotic biosynthesis monooxygenase (ABM) superfamily enzyme